LGFSRNDLLMTDDQFESSESIKAQHRPSSPASLRVATLNTWHGLDGQGTLFFGALESRAERMARLERQTMALKQVNADLLLLQELNPLPFRAHWYAKKLGMRALYVTCNAGIKVGWGLPANLNEGLGILFPPDWQYQNLGQKQLSGHFRFSPFRISVINHPFLSFQLHESRTAFAVRFFLPQEKRLERFEGRTSIIVAVTHLHVSHAQTLRNDEIIKLALEQGHLTQADAAQLRKAFRAAHSRRLNEIDYLADWLDSLRRPDEPMILGGDFNCEPDSPPYNALVRRGWLDLWRECKNSEDLSESATWDAPRNPLTARVKDFQHSQARNHPRFNALYRQMDELPRRIDFLFGLPAKDNPAQKEFQLGAGGYLQKVQRFGYLTGNPIGVESIVSDDFSDYSKRREFDFQPADQKKFISDHHGLYADFVKEKEIT